MKCSYYVREDLHEYPISSSGHVSEYVAVFFLIVFDLWLMTVRILYFLLIIIIILITVNNNIHANYMQYGSTFGICC